MFTAPFLRLSRPLHLLSAMWVILLAVMIFIDVMGRALFSAPFQGTTEILKNSVVSIAFLQVPYAIFLGSMLRTEILAEVIGPVPRRILRTIGALLGIMLFIGLVYSSWTPMWDAYAIGEYEGEGAMRVPTWPVRFLIFVTAAYAAIAYAIMIYLDWTGRLYEEVSAFPPERAEARN
ncbi:MAG: TRAP transporter small permease [Hyphomicrobiales bacterium]|nr:TRAP transporter small permease [Hyphomicrobiales bacterium]